MFLDLIIYVNNKIKQKYRLHFGKNVKRGE